MYQYFIYRFNSLLIIIIAAIIVDDISGGISRKYLGKGNRYPEIMEENGLKSTVIRPGMVLKIPA